MRISGGTYRGRILSVPKGFNVRPTTDKVRQAVFNILLSYGLPADAYVLDVFCGTGALGLEALSRGAAHCLFIDKRRESIACTRKNIDGMGVGPSSYSLLQKDGLKAGVLSSGETPVSLAFFDPPYRKELLAPAMESFAFQGWLADGALCVSECEKEYSGDLPAGFTVLNRRHYGDIQIIISRYK